MVFKIENYKLVNQITGFGKDICSINAAQG